MKRSQSEEQRNHRPDRECPVEGCKERYLNAGTMGTHLDRAHEEAGKWETDRYQQVVDDEGVAIFDSNNPEAYVSSTYAVEMEDR